LLTLTSSKTFFSIYEYSTKPAMCQEKSPIRIFFFEKTTALE
jgi:hypothetical protein